MLTVLLMTSAVVPAAESSQPFNRVRSTYGVTIGTPAAINLSVGRYFSDKYGARLSGGYFPGREDRYAAGVQVNLMTKLTETKNSLLDASIMAGYTELTGCGEDIKYWRFVGVAAGGKWKSLIAEIGLTIGNGSYPNPQASLQLGVVFYAGRRE
jgi:hypothetical protein